MYSEFSLDRFNCTNSIIFHTQVEQYWDDFHKVTRSYLNRCCCTLKIYLNSKKFSWNSPDIKGNIRFCYQAYTCNIKWVIMKKRHHQFKKWLHIHQYMEVKGHEQLIWYHQIFHGVFLSQKSNWLWKLDTNFCKGDNKYPPVYVCSKLWHSAAKAR